VLRRCGAEPSLRVIGNTCDGSEPSARCEPLREREGQSGSRDSPTHRTPAWCAGKYRGYRDTGRGLRTGQVETFAADANSPGLLRWEGVPFVPSATREASADYSWRHGLSG